MPPYAVESRKGQAYDAPATHANLKNLKNAKVKIIPPDIVASAADPEEAGAHIAASAANAEEESNYDSLQERYRFF